MTRSAILCTNICTRPIVSQVLTHTSTMYMPYSEYDHSSSAGWLFCAYRGVVLAKTNKVLDTPDTGQTLCSGP